MDGLAPVAFFWAVSLACKRAGKWLSAVSPPVPKHLHNGANSLTESIFTSLPAASSSGPSRGHGEFCLHCAVRETAFLLWFFFPSVSLDLPGGWCRCWSACRRRLLFFSTSSPPRLLSVSPQWRGALFIHPPRPPCKLPHCGITDSHRQRGAGHN